MRVDIGSETFDAFADQDFASLFLMGDVARATGWALRNPDAQGRGLVSATRMLLRLSYCADPAPLPSDLVIPEVLSEVTSMLAADLLEKPRLFADASSNSNVKSVKAGSASVEFFSSVADAPPIPTALWTMLRNAKLVGCGSVVDEPGAAPFVSGICGEVRPMGGRYQWDWPVTEQDYR